MSKKYLIALRILVVFLIVVEIAVLQVYSIKRQRQNLGLHFSLAQDITYQPQQEKKPSQTKPLITLAGTALVQMHNPIAIKKPQFAPYCAYSPEVSYCVTTVTAYSSTPDQTDSSPFITANGSRVRDGIVACNFLPFGTKIRIPEIYGDKIFTVEDRMARKNNHKIDIWLPSRSEALNFGVKRAKVEILD